MEKLKALLAQAEDLAKQEMANNDKLKVASPHAAILRVRIHAALESLEAHQKHLAAYPETRMANGAATAK